MKLNVKKNQPLDPGLLHKSIFKREKTHRAEESRLEKR